ncbi:MAG TPA: archaetidylserine decarboxylase [Polyangia bacterium]|nr:archaetidylserine decarboxylase [Polyangia bacterium]
MVPKQALTGSIGWLAGLGVPAWCRDALLTRFARLYGIDTKEAARGLSDYDTFDNFFTRQLVPGARTVEPGDDVVTSPADGTVVECGVVVEGQLMQAKGVLFDLEELLADQAAARRLTGGAYLITYLSPKDYHRVHAPIGGKIVGWRHVPGTLFPVNAGSVIREPGLFIRNERFITFIEGAAGMCAVVMVAAVGVGHVTAAYDPTVATHSASFLRAPERARTFEDPPAVAKGDELATFHLGSTTVVVFEPGRIQLRTLENGTKTKMGELIGRILPAETDGLVRSA